MVDGGNGDDVDIIVWRGQNWARIVDLLSEIKAQEPFNKARADALEDAYWYQSFYLAAEKAKTEIAETEKQIAELKKEAAPQKKPESPKTPESEASPQTELKPEKIAQDETLLASFLLGPFFINWQLVIKLYL